MIKKKKNVFGKGLIICFIVFFFLIMTLVLNKENPKRLIGKVNTIDNINFDANNQKKNNVTIDVSGSGFELCDFFVPTMTNQTDIVIAASSGYGQYAVSTFTVSGDKAHLKQNVYSPSNLNAYCIDGGLKDPSGDSYVKTGETSGTYQSISSYIYANNPEPFVSTVAARYIVTQSGLSAFESEEPKKFWGTDVYTFLDKNYIGPGCTSESGTWTLNGKSYSCQVLLPAFDSNRKTAVKTFVNNYASSDKTIMSDEEIRKQIKLEKQYNLETKCSNGDCEATFEIEVNTSVGIENDYGKMLNNVSGINVASVTATDGGKKIRITLQYKENKINDLNGKKLEIGFYVTGLKRYLILKPEAQKRSEQRLLVIEPEKKWFKLVFTLKLEKRPPCEEFYEIIDKATSADAAYKEIEKLIKSSNNPKEYDCCFEKDSTGKYIVTTKKNGQDYYNKYCSCDYVFETIDKITNGGKTNGVSAYNSMTKEDRKFFKKDLKEGMECCYNPPGYVEGKYPKFYAKFCDASCDEIVDTVKNAASAEEAYNKLDESQKDNLVDGNKCCDIIYNRMEQKQVYKDFYQKYCLSCHELVSKIKNGGNFKNDEEKQYFKKECCSFLSKSELESLASVQDICPKPEKCEVSGFKLECDPENNNPVDNYLVYEAYNGNPDDKYDSKYDSYGGCVIDVEFDRHEYLDQGGTIDYEIDGQKRFTQSDAKGNSYYLSQYNNNRYCRISCSERWDFQFSAFQNFVGGDKIQNTLTGTYFDLTKDLYLKGQTNCVTTFIDYELYLNELIAYSKGERAAFNVYQEAEMLYNEAKKQKFEFEDWNSRTNENGFGFFWHGKEGQDFNDKWCIMFEETNSEFYWDVTTKTVPATDSDGNKIINPDGTVATTQVCAYKTPVYVYKCEKYGTCEQGFSRNYNKSPSISLVGWREGQGDTSKETYGYSVSTSASTKDEIEVRGDRVECDGSAPQTKDRAVPTNGLGKRKREDECELAKFSPGEDGGKSEAQLEAEQEILDGLGSEYNPKTGYITLSTSNEQYGSIFDSYYVGTNMDFDSAIAAGKESFSNEHGGEVGEMAGKMLADKKLEQLIGKYSYATVFPKYTSIIPHVFGEYSIDVESGNVSKVYTVKPGNKYSGFSWTDNKTEVCCNYLYVYGRVTNSSGINCNSREYDISTCQQFLNGSDRYSNFGGNNGNSSNIEYKKVYTAPTSYSEQEAFEKYKSDYLKEDDDGFLIGGGQPYKSAMGEAIGRVNSSYKSAINTRALDMAACQNYYLVNANEKYFPGTNDKVENFNYSDPKNFASPYSKLDFVTSIFPKKEYYKAPKADGSFEIKDRVITSAIPVIFNNGNDLKAYNLGLGLLVNKAGENGNILDSNGISLIVRTNYLPKATYGYDEPDYMKMLGINNIIVTDNAKNKRVSGGLEPGMFNVSGGNDSENGQSRVLYINKIRTQAYRTGSAWGNSDSNGKRYGGESSVYDSDKAGSQLPVKDENLRLCGIEKSGGDAEVYNKAMANNGLVQGGGVFDKEVRGCYNIKVYYYDVNYIKQSITNSSFYENYGNFYNSRVDGGLIKTGWAEDLSNAKSKLGGTASPLATDRVGVFPISFSAPVGIHSYRYWFEDIGVYFNNNGKLGRIMSVNMNNVDGKYRSELGGSGGNGDSIVEYNGHICYYELFEQYCKCCGKEIEITIYEHEGYDDQNGKMKAEIEKKIKELGDKYATQSRIVEAVNSSTSGGHLGYYASTVSLNDLKTLTGNWSDSTNLLYDGELHRTKEDKGGALAKEISEYGENAYANLPSGDTRAEYSYTLTPAILKQIKESNGNGNRYTRNDTKYGLSNLVAVESEGIPYNQTDQAEEEPTFVHYKSKYLETLTNEGMFKNANDVCQADKTNVAQVVRKEGIYSQCRFVDYNTSVDINGQNKTFRLPFK